ncbi:esterase [Advenella kashmirensis W13003]|uniref:Esterase n=1 Tax=Advenella kashmirensis W13003 TaxID=1424334 RepID=V8QVL0_9BURK|nr:PHB depolymerase family esterase [Advenella kashmirensis]ETF03682.1 esterase [Advenella kashmirensis W13003]
MARSMSSIFLKTARKIARQQSDALIRATQSNMKLAASAFNHNPLLGVTPAALRRKAKKPVPPPFRHGSWTERIYKVPARITLFFQRLTYFMYVPPEHEVKGSAVLVMLHGCKQTATEFAQGTRMNQLAAKAGMVVIYPQQSRQRQSLRCWRWYLPDAHHGYAEADAIASLVQNLVARHKLDQTRVYLAGMSAGAGMSGLLALRHPALFAAVALHSGPVMGNATSLTSGMQTMRRGTLNDPLTALRTIPDHPGPTQVYLPALILQGQLDRVVAANNGEQLARQFAWLNGFDEHAQPEEKQVGEHTRREYTRFDFRRSRKSIVRYCQIRKIGHAWSGGDSRLDFNSSEGPNASSLMMQFFRMHKREKM